jgi:sodium/potassium/calcium exchanger 6
LLLLVAAAAALSSCAGVFAVMTFCQAIIWLNVSANALVQVTVLLGVIFGVEPAVLGATVLAWGNSAPDLMNNLALARDGFPSMSVAACFASPLFTLLVGMGSALAYGCAMNHGVLAVPVDGTLRVMVGFCALNLLKYLVAVPLLYKFKMTRLMAYLAFLFYAVYNVVYGLTLSGLINIDGWMVGSR